MLSAVIDTNIFVRGLLKCPDESIIIKLLKEEKFAFFISEEIFGEIIEVINRPKFKNAFIPEAIQDLIEIIKLQARIIKPTHKINACRDIEDNKVLECATAAKETNTNIVIVSSDKDLLVLNPFHKIPIISPKDFLIRFNQS